MLSILGQVEVGAYKKPKAVLQAIKKYCLEHESDDAEEEINNVICATMIIYFNLISDLLRLESCSH